MNLPYTRMLPLVGADFMVIINTVQPITCLDCAYYRDYTEHFIKKTICLFFSRKTKKQKNLFLRKKPEYTDHLKKKRLNYENREIMLKR